MTHTRGREETDNTNESVMRCDLYPLLSDDVMNECAGRWRKKGIERKIF